MASAALSRRRLITGAAVATGSALLAGCTPAARYRPGAAARCPLPPVRVSANRRIRSLVGLRPFRRPGFRVERERLGDKTLVHNYGHGGGGITLSWGSSRLALDLGLPGHGGPAAVIGSGIMGLTTAWLLIEQGVPVTIYTKALPPETTSNIAGGEWYPSLVYRSADLTPAFERQFVAAADYSYRRFQIMAGDQYGVHWHDAYQLSHNPIGTGRTRRMLSHILPEGEQLGPGEHPFPLPYAKRTAEMFIEPPVFLRELLEDIRIAGGQIAIRDFEDPARIAALPESLVFNCTGLGARALFGDEQLVPVSGQLEILMPQPEIDYATKAPGVTYMFPRSDGIVLGGTARSGDWSTEPDPQTGDAILARHAAIFDPMACPTADA